MCVEIIVLYSQHHDDISYFSKNLHLNNNFNNVNYK